MKLYEMTNTDDEFNKQIRIIQTAIGKLEGLKTKFGTGNPTVGSQIDSLNFCQRRIANLEQDYIKLRK